MIKTGYTLGNKDELDNLTFVKTVMMLCVVLTHSCSFWTGVWFTAETPVFESPFLNLLSTYLGGVHIFTFTLVSGYLFAYIKGKNGYQRFGPFLVRKAQRLLIPYYFIILV